MTQKKKATRAHTCPCGGSRFEDCCGPLLHGDRVAGSAEQLMRSRYTAYALGLGEYVMGTWHPGTRPATLDLSVEQSQGKWIGLAVLAHRREVDRAEVEFVARYKPAQGPATRLHELSRFVLEGERWWYVDGDIDPS